MKTATRVLLCLSLIFVGARGSAQPLETAEAKNPRRFVRVPAPDGIQIRRYNKTEGRKPEKGDRVAVVYQGTLEDGTVFDSSTRPRPFSLEKVVPCWKEALQLLRVGEKARLRCPPATAYGAKGSPPDIPPNATLIFEIELRAIQ